MKTRTARNLSAGVVAAIAAVASYSHQRDLAAHHGQTQLIAAIIPISVDMMLAVATFAMHEDRANGCKIRPWAWIVLILGVGVSIAANTLAAAPHLLDRLISAWPAIALLGVVEVLANPGKPRAPVTQPSPTPSDAKLPVQAVDGDATVAPKIRRQVPTKRAAVLKAAKALPGGSLAAIAAKADVSEATARRHLNGSRVGDEVTVP